MECLSSLNAERAHRSPASRRPKELLPDDPRDHAYSPFSQTDLHRARMLKQGQTISTYLIAHWHASYRRRAYRRVCDGTPTERRGGAPSGLRRLRADEPAKAITGGALREFIHPTEDRPLTVRECARLQTFPDEFVFEGSTIKSMQQIGNAVPPHFAAVVAGQLASDLQRTQVEYDGGAVLSFVPTNSTGMSPILQEVVARVRREIGQVDEPRQAQLCL